MKTILLITFIITASIVTGSLVKGKEALKEQYRSSHFLIVKDKAEESCKPDVTSSFRL